jgi:hypothetical protein
MSHKSVLGCNECRCDVMGIYVHVTYGIVVDITSM